MNNDYVEIICKKQGMKTLLKNLLALENFTGRAGINRNEGRQIVRRKGKSRTNKINMATLAWIQEQFIRYTREDGSVYIKQERPFIHFNLNSEVYNNFRSGVRNIVRKFASTKFKNPRSLMQYIVDFAVDAQKFIIINKKTAPNKPFTIAKKGFDHPLFDTGKMLRAIKGKVDQLSGKTKKVLKNYDIQRLNKIYKDLGGKA